MIEKNKKKWDEWELIAINYLKDKWHSIIDTNFKFSRFWEIDIISKYDDLTIFIEVKYRTNKIFWEAEESITKNKLFKIKKSIEYYCLTNNISLEKIRFDVITIFKWKETYKLKWYKNIEI